MNCFGKLSTTAFLFVALGTASAFGQSKPSKAPLIPSRITVAVNEQKLVELKGNTHPMAKSAYDKGVVDPQLSMARIQLVLTRSPEQEAALQRFNAEQNDPASPNYHHWLHADEFGKLYGPSDGDIAAITSWLQSHGFTVNDLSKGRVTIEFSGNARQVQQAFHIEMHHYLVNGQMHLANDRDPQIPEALAPVVKGISSLHDFFPKGQSHLGRYVSVNQLTGKITPVSSTSLPVVTSQYSFNDPQAGNAQSEDVGPYDFAAMYNLTPLWISGITGKNVSIAVAAQSNIKMADITAFRTFFGLNTFAGTTSIVLNGADPGIVSGDNIENTLDAEWAGASAPDANILVVTSKSTTTTPGVILSMSYVVNQETAPIMNSSYGECEAYLGLAGNAALNAIYQQGATEGISIFVSSGDQGSTGCDSSNGSAPYAAENGVAVNGFASSPYVTAVGGTDIVWQGKTSTYWGTNSTTHANALGYIPEIPWNATCTSTYVFSIFPGEGTSEKLCNDAINSGFSDLVHVTGGSGGASSCIGGTGTLASCTVGYPKPSWQTGTGVPADGARDLPDLSLFAAGGLPDGILASAYLLCVSSVSPDNACDYTGSNMIFQEVGGTSVSSPAMAGIMALVLQKTGAHQGLANPTLYQLASSQNTAGCNSNTVANGSSCVFYDVTTGTNAMPCLKATTNCVTNTTTDQVGISSGYNATTGYDLATGLGSVNAYNLINAWPAVSTSTTTVSVTPTSSNFPSTTVKTTSSTTGTVTVTNTGTTAISFTGISITGTNASSFSDTTTCSLSLALAAGAACNIVVSFAPATTGTLSASLNIVDNAGTQTVSLTGTGASASTTTVSVTPTSSNFPSTTVNMTSSTTGTVTITNTGTTAISFTGITITGTNASSFSDTTTCSLSMALATGAACNVVVSFTPATTGTLSASLNIVDNVGTQTVSLTGTGASAPTTTMSVTPTSLTFGSTSLASPAPIQTVTLQNTGTASITLGTPSITGANATSFSQTPACGATLASGVSCTISIGFTPTATGSLVATLNIPSNATGAPQSVSLMGTGAAVALSTTTTLTASAYSAAPGTPITLTATVTPSTAAPGTTVTFYNGNFILGTGTLNSSAVATLNVSFVNAGVYSLTATYAGNSAFTGSTSTAITETVGSAGVSATVSPSPLTIPAGNTGALTIAVTPFGGYTGTVALSCGTMPQFASCTFASQSLAITSAGGPYTDTLTIGTSSTYTLTQNRLRGQSSQIASAAFLLPGALAVLFCLGRRKHFTAAARRLWLVAFLCLGLVGIGAITGCGGGPKTYTFSNTTAAGSYTIPVILTLPAGGSQTVNATVIVQ